MNDPIRIMLCDDSAVMRRLIKTALQADPTMAVVSEAKHGLDALNKLYDARPDVLVMDVQMPVMDGIDAVREIRKRTSKLPVIMFSSLTSHGAEATQDAINAGATEVATKPASIGHIKDAMDHVQKELIPKIYRSLGIVPRAVAPQRTAPPRAVRPQNVRAQNVSRPVGRQPSSGRGEGLGAIGVGVSTGGPEALEQLILALPLDFPSPILVVQHMPPVFTKRLADRLAMKTGHRVREAKNGEELRAGEILIAPGDYHLLIARDRSSVRAKLTKDAPENSCRPAVDPLFRSLADAFGDQCLGVVLTGMGKDGTNGARALRECGAEVMVQDKQSSVVWGMAGNIVEHGLSDEVLPLGRMAEEMIRRARGRMPVR